MTRERKQTIKRRKGVRAFERSKQSDQVISIELKIFIASFQKFAYTPFNNKERFDVFTDGATIIRSAVSAAGEPLGAARVAEGERHCWVRKKCISNVPGARSTRVPAKKRVWVC